MNTDRIDLTTDEHGNVKSYYLAEPQSSQRENEKRIRSGYQEEAILAHGRSVIL
jgi:hypothetical protein